MFLHVGPYRPYFGFGYSGMGSVPTMWLPMSSPFINITTTPKPIFGVAQAKVVIDNGECFTNDDIYKHNPKMPHILPTIKPYNERKGRPSLIGDNDGLPTSGTNVPTSGNGGGPFYASGNDPLKGGPLRDKNPTIHIVGPS
jgi:hypothetical protein